MSDVECSSMRDDEGAACGRILSSSFGRSVPRDVRRDSESDVCVAREAGAVRGLVVVRDRRAGFGGGFVRGACISSLCVDERERSRGLGTALVASTLRAAHARGVAAAILIPRTVGLYARLGFAPGGTRFACAFELPRAPALSGSEKVRAFKRGD